MVASVRSQASGEQDEASCPAPVQLKRGAVLQFQTFTWKMWMMKVLHLPPGSFSCLGKLLVPPKYAGSKGSLNY